MNEPAHILLIEDDQTHAELVRQSFEFHADRFRLTVVYSLDEARELLAGFQPDLVITDLILPDALGTELLPSEKESLSFPVIVITSYGDQRVAVEAMKAGALDYVVKSEATLADMPHIAERGLREWGHIISRKRAEEEREKLIQKLQAALAKVKTLGGLLPICSSCKKIRDDKGYWNQIEGYIRDHSEAEFSHSLCPECAKKLYPNFYEKSGSEIDRRRYSFDAQIPKRFVGQDRRSGLERRTGTGRRSGIERRAAA
jgi:CheY-like chemotaxis protein